MQAQALRKHKAVLNRAVQSSACCLPSCRPMRTLTNCPQYEQMEASEGQDKLRALFEEQQRYKAQAARAELSNESLAAQVQELRLRCMSKCRSGTQGLCLRCFSQCSLNAGAVPAAHE